MFIFLEIIFSFISPYNLNFPKGTFEKDNQSGFGFAANKTFSHSTSEYSYDITINEYGFRDKGFDFIADKPKKIICLGDSMTFGTGIDIDDTYCEIISDELNSKSDILQNHTPRYDSINLGIPAYNLEQQLNRLKQYEDFNPSAIVTFVYLGNDVDETTGRIKYDVDTSGRLINADSQDVNMLRKMRKSIISNSRFLSFVYLRVEAIIGTKKYKFDKASQYRLELSRKTYSDPIKQDLDYTISFLEKTNLYAQSIGAEYIVVLIPSKHTANNKDFQDYLSVFDVDTSDFNPNSLSDYFEDSLEKKGIATINLQKVFFDYNKRYPGVRFYFKEDIHLNKNGHELIGKLVAQRLNNTV
jgi:lysophospholipase L1-like esterase